VIFVAESTDSNTTRQKRQSAVGGKLTPRYLQKDAVPSIFAAAPSYLSAKKKSPRKTASLFQQVGTSNNKDS